MKIILVGASALGLTLSFAAGSREVVGSILAGYYLRKSLREGISVDINGRSGRLSRVGPIDTLFDVGIQLDNLIAQALHSFFTAINPCLDGGNR